MRGPTTARCHRAADDRSALRRPHGARDCAVVARQPGSLGIRRCAGELERPDFRPKATDEFSWRKVLHDGFIADTLSRRRAAGARPRLAWRHYGASCKRGALEIVFRPDPISTTDATRTWAGCRKLPRPVTNLSWDNAALMSYATLEKCISPSTTWSRSR